MTKARASKKLAIVRFVTDGDAPRRVINRDVHTEDVVPWSLITIGEVPAEGGDEVVQNSIARQAASGGRFLGQTHK